MTTSAAGQPRIPQPSATVTALRQAVSQIAPAALPAFTRELGQAADQSRQGSELGPLQRFIAQWAVYVHIQRHPDLAHQLRSGRTPPKGTTSLKHGEPSPRSARSWMQRTRPSAFRSGELVVVLGGTARTVLK